MLDIGAGIDQQPDGARSTKPYHCTLSQNPVGYPDDLPYDGKDRYHPCQPQICCCSLLAHDVLLLRCRAIMGCDSALIYVGLPQAQNEEAPPERGGVVTACSTAFLEGPQNRCNP